MQGISSVDTKDMIQLSIHLEGVQLVRNLPAYSSDKMDELNKTSNMPI